MATSTGTVELIAKIDTGNYEKGADKIDTANKKISGSSDSADSSLGKLARNGLKVAVVGIAGLATAIGAMTIKGGISRALNIEDAQAKLKGLGHDANSVKNIMNSALDSVRGTAYGLDSAATLAATAVAAGVKPGQELTKYLSLTADAATIAGVSLDEMGSVFGKVQTQQKAYTQELNMLADRGIPIYQWLQEELGVTQETLRDMVANGEVDSATYFRAVQKNIGGAALESGKTTRGAYQNLLAAMSRIGERIVKGPIDDIREGFGDLTRWIDSNADTIVSTVQGAIRIAGQTLSTTFDIIRNGAPVIITSTAAWVGYSVTVGAVTTAIKLYTSAQLLLNTAMKANPIGLLVGALTGLVAIFTLVNSSTDNSKAAQDRLNQARNDAKVANDNLRMSEDALKDAQLRVEGSALAVERAQRNLTSAELQYGKGSLEAREAALQLKNAQRELENANNAAKDATNNNTQAQKDFAKAKDDIIKAQNAVAAATGNSASQYQRLANTARDAAKAQDEIRKQGGVSTPTQQLRSAGLPTMNVPGGRAKGGPVRAGQPYFVGENPDGSLNSTSELFVPNSSGRIINSKDLQSSLGGSNIEYNISNINISSEVDGERWLRRLTGDSEIVSYGLVPQQRYMEAN